MPLLALAQASHPQRVAPVLKSGLPINSMYAECAMAKVIPLFSSNDIMTFELEVWDTEWHQVLDQLDDANLIPF